MENKVLVVDDEKEIRDFLFKALSRLGGFQVELAKNGEEALKKIDEGKFDLVLMDIKMPKMDGLQLVAEINKTKPEILTVLMTGHGTVDSALEAMKHGASDYLTKPLHLEELLIRLRKVLEEKRRFINLKEYAAQLEKANQVLKRVDEMKSEFVSVASHELRTPLAAVKNVVQLLARGKTGEINQIQMKFLSMAERNIDRLTNILNNLLDLSRIESGKTDLKLEEIKISGPIEFVLSSLKTQADGKTIQLKMEVPEELPPVYGDREKVEQILINLVGNAIKFTPEGGEITVSAGPLPGNEGMLAISVQDTGIGIQEDQIERIFEKFHQIEGSLHRSASGTGLGLAITKGLVEAHQGTISVKSEMRKGSVFTFTLATSKREKRDVRFRLILDREFRRARENFSPLTLFLIEVFDDAAKLEEAIMKELEEQLRKCLHRKTDFLLRRSREKVLAAICEADLTGAQVIRQRIEGQMQNFFLRDWNPPPSIKVGTATYPEEVLSKRELFGKAKERLRG